MRPGDFTTFDTVTAERIEVLKGPAAVLYGRVEQPGGLINLVTKKPLDAPYYSAEQQFGSYEFFRTQWDATGPLNQDRSLLYRFTGAYQNNDSFRDFHDLERVVLYPSLTWRPTSATEATVDLEYIHDDTHVDYVGIPAIGRRPAPVPISRSFQDPNDPSETFDRVRLGFNLSHRFNESWTLNNRFLAAFLRIRCNIWISCWASVLIATKRIPGRLTASQMASASLPSFFLPLR